MQTAVIRSRSLFYQPFLASPLLSCLLGIGADKSAVSGKRMTANKKQKNTHTHTVKCLKKTVNFQKKIELFLLKVLLTVASNSFNYRYIEKTIIHLIRLNGAGGTEELSRDKM